MNTAELLDIMQEVFDGLIAIHVEGESHEANVVYTQAVRERVMTAARAARQQRRQPPGLTLFLAGQNGETVELQLTLNYQQERVSS